MKQGYVNETPRRGATNEWLTPPEIIRALGPFDLDPCAAVGQPWRTARRQYTIKTDGLSRSWRGFVWCNPPFGADAGEWLRRLADHDDGVALVAARTETRWFIEVVWKSADAVLFLNKRVHFHHACGARAKLALPAPICLVAYGPTAVRRLRECDIAGTFISRWRVREASRA